MQGALRLLGDPPRSRFAVPVLRLLDVGHVQWTPMQNSFDSGSSIVTK